MEVSHATGGTPELVLDSIVKYASPEMRSALMARANMVTTDWLLQAESLANFSQAMALEERLARGPGREGNATSEVTVGATCGHCKKKGHTAEECRKK